MIHLDLLQGQVRDLSIEGDGEKPKLNVFQNASCLGYQVCSVANIWIN